MLRELTQAVRHFSKRKVNFTIIVLSLAAGFACSFLLLSFLLSENQVDRFHVRSERTYQVASNNPFGGDGHVVYGIGGLPNFLASNFPEVESACQVSNADGSEIEVSAGSFSPLVTINADSNFLRVFDFGIDVKRFTPNTILVSKTLALKIFGTVDIENRDVAWRSADTTRTLRIAGIFQPLGKSHLVPDAIRWGSPNGGATYVVLKEGTSPLAFASKVNADSLRPTILGPGKLSYTFQPLQESYLDSTNRFAFMQTRSRSFLQVGWVVAIAVLIIACFNFVNLTLQSWQERTTQTGIKKTLGVSSQRLWLGALVEIVALVGVSFALSIVLMSAVLPAFNQLVKSDLTIGSLLQSGVAIWIVAAMALIIVVITFVIFIFQRRVVPIQLLQHRLVALKEGQVLFTLQFVVAVTLCICATVMIRQIQYLEEEPLGFNRNLLQIAPPPGRQDLLPALKDQLLQSSYVDHVALSEGNPISGNMIARYELEDGNVFTPYLFQGDEDLLPTLKLSSVEGSVELNDTTDVLVNETLVRQFAMVSPVGQIIPGTRQRITGVVKDFMCSSFKQQVPPVIISYQPHAKLALVDYSGKELKAILPSVRYAWQTVYGNSYMAVHVLQDDLMKKYSDETMLFQVVIATSIVSIVLSCFGLFAMSISVIRRRRREMGIRKVLGAMATDVVWILSTSFFKRASIAFVLAAPVAFYLMNEWLARFAYRVSIDGREFLLSGVTMVLVVVATLVVQTVRAARVNPVDEIKDLHQR